VPLGVVLRTHHSWTEPSSPCWVPSGLIAAFELHVRRVEEPYLRRTHGDEYAAYAAQVGRFVPGIGRMGVPA
jgi:protein-S-isoprenylcysteine O-methyltransferase Ste14